MLQNKYDSLKKNLHQMNKTIVAYSGGIDSTLLLKVAYDCLEKNAVGITVVSPSIAKTELEEAKSIAKHIGVRHILVDSHEMEDQNYVENSENRCYFCKSNAYDEIFKFADREGFSFILDGTNAEDVDDFRPGRKAALERGVRSPLQENGITKAEIRKLAKNLGLPNWDKPAAACLSSRIPYGTQVTTENLSQVEQSEQVLKNMGFRQVRVRHHDLVARIEIEPADFKAVLNQREKIVATIKDIGYNYVTLDLLGFRSGSMNEVLKKDER